MDQFTVMVGGIVYVFNDFQLWEVMDMLDSLAVDTYTA